MVEVTGDLDMAAAPLLREGLQRVLDAGTHNVVVDLAGVEFMDSSGLGTLVAMFKTARECGGSLCLAAVQQQVRSLLSITSVDRVIGVYDTVLAAEANVPSGVA